jgi:hypothetical protein
MDWEAAEEIVAHLFPEARRTKGSGSVHGNGDLISSLMIFEVKDQAKVSLDRWWRKIRKEALGWGKEPVLVIRRPHALGVGEELVACVRVEYLSELVHGQEETPTQEE